MDPLSIVSIAGTTTHLIATIAQSITKQLDDFRNIKNANKASADLISELHSMKLILDQYGKLVASDGFFQHQPGDSRTSILSSLESCQKTLQDLDQRQESLNSGGKRSRFKSLYTSSLRQRDMDKLIHSLQMQRTELQLLMQMCARYSSYLQGIADMYAHSQVLQANNQLRGPTAPIDIPSTKTAFDSAAENNEILEWLTTFDYQSRHHELSRVHAPNTGDWFLKSEEFQTWCTGRPFQEGRTKRSNVLWCHGIPGSGKSVLKATAVDHLTLEASRDSSRGLAYFYFDYKVKSSERDVISCLLKQLCIQRGEIPESLRQLYERYKDQGLSRSWETIKAKQGPETAELFAALLDVASDFRRTLFCLDGLDECAREYQPSLLVLIRRIMKSKCGLLATGRSEPSYIDLFQGKAELRVHAAPSDIEAYVGLVLSNHPELRDMVDERLEHRIATFLSQKSNGLFLFVYLSMQSLLEQTSASEVKAALDDMPTSLENVYSGILQRIRQQSTSRSNLAMRILMWLSYCERQLSVRELQHAVAIDPDIDTNDLDGERIPPSRFFEDVCMDLVSIDKDRGTVLLAHASLSHYLSELRQSLFPRGSRDLALSMLSYMKFSEFWSGPCTDNAKFRSRLERYPLSIYVARHWGDHVKEYWQGRVEEDVMSFLADPLRRMALVQIMYASKSDEGGVAFQDYPTDTTGLHLASYFGVEQAVASILSSYNGAAICSADSWGRTPLHSACERCLSTSIVEKLLAQDLQVGAQDREGRTAIHYASKIGKLDIVMQLLKHNADPGQYDFTGRSAFDYAAAEGHTEVVLQFLQQGSVGHFGDSNALYVAAANGHAGIVELLLDAGIEHREVEALHEAAKSGFEDIVKILLERGADLNSKDGRSMTALHYASAAGRTSMVKLLLANGSNVTARDRKGRTALFLAAERGDEATLRVLSEYGAEIEARNLEGRTALFECAKKGNAVGVEFLLRRGATVNSTSSSESSESIEIQENALQVAARNGHESVVRLLFEKYPDSSQGLTNRTTLSYAAEGGHIGVVEFLLEAGVEVDARDDNPECRTPLTYAVEAGHLEAATLLLTSGARVDIDTIMQRTPLFYAVRGGHLDTTRLLLDHGANPDSAGKSSNTTPLIYAVQRGNAAIADLLIERGADPDFEDTDGHIAAYYALERGDDAILALLHKPVGSVRSTTDMLFRDSDLDFNTSTALGYAGMKDMFRSQSDTGPRRGRIFRE